MLLKYWRACSVISIVGRVWPQAIMFHLTPTYKEKLGLDILLNRMRISESKSQDYTFDFGDCFEAEYPMEVPGEPEQWRPESSGSVSFKIDGGEKIIEASLVPTKDLLGVSGFEKLASVTPTPLNMVDAQFVASDLRAFFPGV